jgi:hypothetical protein
MQKVPERPRPGLHRGRGPARGDPRGAARAQSGDIVVIAGKGHEQSIIYGSEARPWDDRLVAREELGNLGFMSG